MSKSILVIDTPESCDKCPLLLYSMEERCCVPEKRNSFNTKPEWCPLKPLPKKIDFNGAFEAGYNWCIDDILGGKNI